MKLRYCLIYIAILLPTVLCAQSKEYWWGGGLAYEIPTNLLSEDDFGFGTVANGGMGFMASGIWFYNPQLSLSADAGYHYFKKDRNFWDVDRYGLVDMKYRMISANVQGNLYVNQKGTLRPYIGALFGAYYIMNRLQFTSSNELANQSSSYKSNQAQVGIGLELGSLIQINNKEKLQLALRFTYIPNIEPEYYPEDDVTVNPHGRQNHWGLSMKYFIAAKK